jgi:hypothetical protein
MDNRQVYNKWQENQKIVVYHIFINYFPKIQGVLIMSAKFKEFSRALK